MFQKQQRDGGGRGPPGGFGGVGRGGGGGGGGYGNKPDMDGEPMTSFPVPADKCGLVIGKGM